MLIEVCKEFVFMKPKGNLFLLLVLLSKEYDLINKNGLGEIQNLQVIRLLENWKLRLQESTFKWFA